MRNKPFCQTCGVNSVTEIKWLEETYVDPLYIKNIPSLQNFFMAFYKFSNVSEDVQERREKDGLTLQEIEELEDIKRTPCVNELIEYMKKKPLRVQEPLCKNCGKRVFPISAPVRESTIV